MDHILENGLRLLVQPVSTSPIAAVYLWMDAGVIDELPGEEGAAHFLEHMWFKGSAARAPGAAAAEVEGLGGELNAFTSYDETVLHATVEASSAGQAIAILADMMLQRSLDPDEIEREKQVVYEEIAAYDGDPNARLEDHSSERLFPDHPYGRPILAGRDAVHALTRETLLQFALRCHLPHRAILAVVGDVEPDQILSAVNACFGRWEGSTGQPVARSFPAPPTPADPVAERLRGEFESTAVSMVWRGPSFSDPDAPALEVLLTALGEGASALLANRLQQDEELAGEIASDLSLMTQGGTLGLSFIPREGKTIAAIEAALDEIGRVVSRGLPGAWMHRAKDAILTDFLFATEGVDDIAHDLVSYTARFGNPSAREQQRRSVAALTREDVQAAARRWLDPAKASIFVLDPAVKPNALERSVQRARINPHSPAQNGLHRFTLSNGVRVVVLTEDLPMVAVDVIAIGGAIAEDRKIAGIGSAWSRMIQAGAGDLSAADLANALDDISATLDAGVGRGTLGLRSTFPAMWGAEGLQLFGTLLADPRFEQEEWERVAEELADDLRTQSDRPAEIADDKLWAALWPDHPWGLPALGLPATLRTLNPKRFRRWHREQLATDNIVISVVGGIGEEEVREALEPLLKDLPSQSVIPPRALSPYQPTSIQVQGGHEQVHCLLGARFPKLNPEESRALRLLATALHGQGGRLFLALREQRALAYDVWADAASGVDGGVFSIGLSTDPERAAEARSALQEEWKRILSEPLRLDEVSRYQRMLVGQTALALQRASGRAADLSFSERFSLPAGLAEHRRALEAITPEAIAAAFAKVGEFTEISVLPQHRRR